jgi:hypothetical protein
MLLASYPSSTPTDAETYIALVVAVFTQFKFEVVENACSPNGIPVASPKFLPTIGEINDWCIKRAADFRKTYSTGEHMMIAKPFVPPPLKPGQITYGEFLSRSAEWKSESKPIGAFEKGGYLGRRA